MHAQARSAGSKGGSRCRRLIDVADASLAALKNTQGDPGTAATAIAPQRTIHDRSRRPRAVRTSLAVRVGSRTARIGSCRTVVYQSPRRTGRVAVRTTRTQEPAEVAHGLTQGARQRGGTGGGRYL